MPIGLIRLITTQKVLKTCSNKSVKQHCLGSNHKYNLSGRKILHTVICVLIEKC